MYAEVVVRGRMFRVDSSGAYDELVDLPLSRLTMTEPDQDMRKVEQYAAMYCAGSPFPPISVAAPTSQNPQYDITNGHHRYLAAKQVKATTIPAWTCFYVEYKLDYDRKPFATLARVSETKIGRAIARVIGITWCSHCGGSLNLKPGRALCWSCELAAKQMTLPESEFERLDKILSEGERRGRISQLRPMEDRIALG